MDKDFYELALEALENLDIRVPKNCLVLYSVSYLKTQENKEKALDFIKKNPQMMLLEQTECGKKLLELGFDGSLETKIEKQKAYDIWRSFLQKGIRLTSGNVTAFVDKADACGKFLDVCLKALLDNDEIETINGIDKFEFVQTCVNWKHVGRQIDEKVNNL